METKKTGDAIENAGSNNPTRHGEAGSDVLTAGNIHVGSAGHSSEALRPQAYPYRAQGASPFPRQAAVDNGGTLTQPTSRKCGVFEVVLIRQEMTICPACARSPKRARLPAYARGIYGQS
jgi:hypothetical protein